MVISDQSMTVFLATVPGHCSKMFCKLAMLQIISCDSLVSHGACMQNMFVFDRVPVPAIRRRGWPQLWRTKRTKAKHTPGGPGGVRVGPWPQVGVCSGPAPGA